MVVAITSLLKRSAPNRDDPESRHVAHPCSRAMIESINGVAHPHDLWRHITKSLNAKSRPRGNLMADSFRDARRLDRSHANQHFIWKRAISVRRVGCITSDERTRIELIYVSLQCPSLRDGDEGKSRRSVMLLPVGGKESSQESGMESISRRGRTDGAATEAIDQHINIQPLKLESSPRRQPAAAETDMDTDIHRPNLADIEAQLEAQSNSHLNRTDSSNESATPKNANMEENRRHPPEKPKFNWSRIRESPAFAAHLWTSETPGERVRLTYSPVNRLSPINGRIEVERSADKSDDESNREQQLANPTSNLATPRPTSSVYDQDDTLAPPSLVHQSSLSLRLPEKQHINYSRPSSPRSYKSPRAPSSLYDNANTLPPSPTHQSPTPRSWEKTSFNFPPTSASPDCTPRPPPPPSPSDFGHHHPGTEYQLSPPRQEKSNMYHHHRPSSSPTASAPTPRPPLYQPCRTPKPGRRKMPSFLLPSWVVPRMRKKYRKRLSGALFALFFVGTLGMGIGFLIAGVGDDRRVSEGENGVVGTGGKAGEGLKQHRIPWMITAGGSILGLHGCFVIAMLVLYGPSCF